MIGRLIKFIFQLIGSVVIVFVFTAGILALDGSTDQGTKAETGLVVCDAPVKKSGGDPVLDRAVKLHKEGSFETVIVASTVDHFTSTGEPQAMAKYLEEHGVSEDAILVERAEHADNVPAIAASTAQTMKTRKLDSVIIVAPYYRITGLKLALYHHGLLQIGKAHAGNIGVGDIPAILVSTVELFRYVTTVYLVPAAEKVREEAKAGTDQVKQDAEKAKQKVDKSLDSLPK